MKRVKNKSLKEDKETKEKKEIVAKQSISTLVNEYLELVNKMGEYVSQTNKISKKLSNVEWFVGVFFLYKRFLYERKKIEKWL